MADSAQIRVVVIDDHDLFRAGLIQLLVQRRISVVGEAKLAAEGIRTVTDLRPDVVLIDLSLPGMSGLEAIHRLHATRPDVQVLVLSALADERSVTDAVLAGATGYLLKDGEIDEVLRAISAAAHGRSFFSVAVTGHLLRHIRRPTRREGDPSSIGLTPRELEILKLIVRGMDNPEIAGSLILSSHTVKNHVSNILDKLGVDNRLQAAVRAVREGLA